MRRDVDVRRIPLPYSQMQSRRASLTGTFFAMLSRSALPAGLVVWAAPGALAEASLMLLRSPTQQGCWRASPASRSCGPGSVVSLPLTEAGAAPVNRLHHVPARGRTPSLAALLHLLQSAPTQTYALPARTYLSRAESLSFRALCRCGHTRTDASLPPMLGFDSRALPPLRP